MDESIKVKIGANFNDFFSNQNFEHWSADVKWPNGVTNSFSGGNQHCKKLFEVNTLGVRAGIIFKCTNPNKIRHTKDYDLLKNLLQFFIEDVWNSHLIKKLSQPLEVTENFSDYLPKLLEIARQCALADAVVYRQIDGPLLRLVGLNSKDAFNRRPPQEISALHKIGSTILNSSEDQFGYFHNQASLVVRNCRVSDPDLQTIFSAPVVVSGKKIGLLNFHYHNALEYSEKIFQGLDLIANTIGTAYSNALLSNITTDRKIKEFSLIQNVSNYEIVQGFRHWASKALLGLDTAILDLKLLTKISDLDQQMEKIMIERAKVGKSMSSMAEVGQNSDFKPSAFLLSDLVSDVGGLFEAEFEKDFSVYENGQNNVQVKANRELCKGLLLNLVLNSIQACRSVKKKEYTISIRYISDRIGYWGIKYKDTGPGIRNHKKIKSTRDIFRAGVSTRPDGTGMGMVMVKEVINLHNGDFNMISSLNSGGFELDMYFKEAN